MNVVIPLILFPVLAVIVLRWVRLAIVKYRLTENALKIEIFGLPIFRIPYKNIRRCEFVGASKLWRLSTFFMFPLWLHTRLFVDGIIIQAKWRRYVLTPKNPEEFVKLIMEKRNGTAP